MSKTKTKHDQRLWHELDKLEKVTWLSLPFLSRLKWKNKIKILFQVNVKISLSLNLKIITK